MTRRPVVQFVAGVTFGAISAVVALEIGLLFGTGIILVIGIVGLLGARFAFLAGTLIGQGATILLLLARTDSACSLTADYCGQANLLPLTLIGALLVVSGVLLTVITTANAMRR